MVDRDSGGCISNYSEAKEVTSSDIQAELQRADTLLKEELARSNPVTRWLAQWIIRHNQKKRAEVICATITNASEEILQKI